MIQFSKRAARRLIQRAWVLVEREKQLRQPFREARLTTLWVIEDSEFAWTVVFDRGRIDFERRPARHPDVVFSWRTAQDFYSQVEDGVPAEGGFDFQGKQE